MNKYLKITIISFTMILQSCISGTPDCDDVNKQNLKWNLISNEHNILHKERIKTLESLKNYWIEQGYKEISLNDKYNRGIKLDSIDKIKNDSIGLLWDKSVARLDTLWNLKKETLENTLSNLKFLDEIRLIRESENSSLTKFHCDCQIQFEVDGKNGELGYKLTRKDWDTQTYQKVNYTSLKFNSMVTNKDWEYLIK